MEIKECLKCGKCCKTLVDEECTVLILPSDVVEISRYLGIKRIDFVKMFCKENLLHVAGLEVKMFVLKFPEDKCIFLKADNLCNVYQYRPKQCKNAPYNFFSSVKLWENLPCVDINHLKECDSKQADQENTRELLRGYELEDN